MVTMKKSLTLVAIFFITYTATSTSAASCTRSTYKKLELSLANRKNDTGHWITDLEADFEGETPNVWKINVERLATECDGDREVRLKATVSVPPPRPKDYEYYPGIGYYKFHTNTMNWDEAKSTCEQEGAHLAILNSEEESKVLQQIFGRYPGDWTFVGFHDRYKEGEFVTIFGQPLSSTGFTRWSHSEQPDDAGGHEDCGTIHKNGGLNDYPCNGKTTFICEYELW